MNDLSVILLIITAVCIIGSAVINNYVLKTSRINTDEIIKEALTIVTDIKENNCLTCQNYQECWEIAVVTDFRNVTIQYLEIPYWPMTENRCSNYIRKTYCNERGNQYIRLAPSWRNAGQFMEEKTCDKANWSRDWVCKDFKPKNLGDKEIWNKYK